MSRIPSLLVLLFLAISARAGEPVAFELGDRYVGIVSVPGGDDDVGFPGLGGERVRARVKVDKGDSLEPVLELVELATDTVLVSVIGKGRVAKLPLTTLPADGSYSLRVSGVAAGTGRFELRTASRLSPELAKLIVAPSDASPLIVPFAAKAGARLKARFGPDKGSEARPIDALLVGPEGAIDLLGALMIKGTSLRVSLDELPITGDYELRIVPDGAAGALKGRVKLSARKQQSVIVFKPGILPVVHFLSGDSEVGEGDGVSGHDVSVTLVLPFGGDLPSPVSATVSLDEQQTTATAGVDFVATPPQVVKFPAGSTHGATLPVEVATLEDEFFDGGELIALRLSDVSPHAVLGEPMTHTVKIVDNEQSPPPGIVSFTVDHSEPALGDTVTFSWELEHAAQPGVRIELDTNNDTWPEFTYDDPETLGSQAVVITNGANTLARLRIFLDDDYLGIATVPMDPSGLALYVVEPGAGELGPSALLVSADVISEFELQSFTARVGSVSTDMVLGGQAQGGFSGELDLSGLPQGEVYVVEVEAVDFQGTVASATRPFVLDDPPVLQVLEPTGVTGWALPELLVQASCEDSVSESCTLTVRVNGDAGNETLITTTDAVDAQLDLTPWDGEKVSVLFRASDDQGQSTSLSVSVQVEASPRLEQLVVVPDAVEVLDADDARVLFLSGHGSSPPLSLYDVAADQSTEILPGETAIHSGQEARLTPSGAAFLAYPGEHILYSWKDGALSEVAELTQSDWAIAGELVLAEEELPNSPECLLTIFDLDAETRTVVAADDMVYPTAGFDVDDAGNVAYTDANGQVRSVINGVETQHTTPSTDYHHQTRVEGSRVLWRLTPCCSLPDEAVKVWDDGAESFLAPWEPWTWFPTFDVAGDWIAYTRAGTVFQNGNLWIRDPDGVDVQVTGSAEQVTLLALSPDGEAMVRIGGQLWLATSTSLEQLTFSPTLPYVVRWTDGGWRLLRKDAVFGLLD
jgi:hypothetical protein